MSSVCRERVGTLLRVAALEVICLFDLGSGELVSRARFLGGEMTVMSGDGDGSATDMSDTVLQLTFSRHSCRRRLTGLWIYVKVVK